MSSSVFFKFKSQKEPSRVMFDGTGISVFELKKEIININKLGSGADFDLAIHNQDTNEEYDDDTVIIPRSTSIVARRLPPAKPGKGNAQRYVRGNMPINALPSSGRRGRNGASQVAKKADNRSSARPAAGESEEDRINAMLSANTEQWDKTQEQLATATPVYRNGGGPKKSTPPPNHPPPTGYVCYRCGEKGHWIQACPTNADPNFDGRPRIKRTTGIPRSLLRAVERPMPQARNDPTAGPGGPTSVMVNAEGEYVVAMADQASWENYQKKAGVAKADALKGCKELQEKGIECGLCKMLMKDAAKTPCCNKAYCEDCIQNALVESDFVCPSCEARDVLLDSLIPDEEARKKVNEHEEKEKPVDDNTKVSNTTENQESRSPNPAAAKEANSHKPILATKSESQPPPAHLGSTLSQSPAPSTASKKRPAEDEIGPEVPRGPAVMQKQQAIEQSRMNSFAGAFSNQVYGGLGGLGPLMGVMNSVDMNHMNMMNGASLFPTLFGGGFGNGVGMNDMNNMSGMMGPIGMGFPGAQALGDRGLSNGLRNMSGYGNGSAYQTNGYGHGMGYQGLGSQQRMAFAEPFPGEEDSPYMRKPVNPHRYPRPERVRPSDFKAVCGGMA